MSRRPRRPWACRPTRRSSATCSARNWADEHPDLVQAFARASHAAKAIMDESDEEWERLRPLTRAEDDATLDALKRRYREGIVHSWGEQERAGRRHSSMRCSPSSVARSWSAARRCWSMAHSGPVSATRTARESAQAAAGTGSSRPPAAAGDGVVAHPAAGCSRFCCCSRSGRSPHRRRQIPG